MRIIIKYNNSNNENSAPQFQSRELVAYVGIICIPSQ